LKDPRKKRKRRKRKRSEVTGSAAGAEAVILNWRTYKRKEKKTRERLAGIAGSVKALRSALDKKEPKGLFFTA
jgi:hypothetical protein